MKRCDGCEASEKDEDFVFQTEFWNVFLAPDQRYLGRCYVSLKRHCGSLTDLRDEEWMDFKELVKRLEGALRKSFGATLFNWGCLMNNAFQEKPYNPHVHWHFRPRYEHEVRFADETFIDKEFGHHYARGFENEVVIDEKKFEKVVAEIRKNL